MTPLRGLGSVRVLGAVAIAVAVVGCAPDAALGVVSAPVAGAVPATTPVAPPAASDVPGATTGATSTPATADASASSPQSGGDPLTENGLGSVLCREPSVASSLSAAAQANCATSSFVAAAAPTGNYAFDVHINTGALGVTENVLDVCIQDFVLVPIWTALLWIVHALLVGVEWCYTLDLLNGATLGGVASALRSVQATLTQPAMAFALAVASILALYQGLVRRRVAQTLAEVLVMFVMMACGLWVVLDPLGTIGTLGHWADQTSLGLLAAVSAGEPQGGDGSLAAGTSELFAGTIAGPWCYLEFGNVDWCRHADRLDPQLRAAARAIETRDQGSSAASQRTSAELLARAQTNGDLFLALPANGPDRNSINDTGSLLHVLCGTSDATSCTGPTASEAEFRTQGGTVARAGGLLLVVIGAAGMIAVLAFVIARLLGAAVATLLYLLLAPAVVLAPAFGEGGRAAFRTWATRLLGALAAKLLYSLVLGILLLILRIVDGLGTIGWWTQWLLVTCLWWTAFQRRHQLLEYLHAPRAEIPSGPSRRVRALRAGATLVYGRELWRHLHDRGGDRLPPEPRRPPQPHRPDPYSPKPGSDPPDSGFDATGGGRPPRDGGDPPRTPRPAGSDDGDHEAGSDAQWGKERRPDRASALPLEADPPPTLGASRAGPADGQDKPTPGDDRLSRVEREQQLARSAGDIRRAARLQHRARRIRAELESVDTAGAGAGRRVGGGPLTAAFLDQQMQLAGARERRGSTPGRDYRSLAPIAGLAPAAYAQLSAGAQRSARLAIDHELDDRRRIGARRAGASDQRTSGEDGGGERPQRAAGQALAPVFASGSDAEAGDSDPPEGLAVPRRGRDPRARPGPIAPRPADESVVVRRERQFAARAVERDGQGADPRS